MSTQDYIDARNKAVATCNTMKYNMLDTLFQTGYNRGWDKGLDHSRKQLTDKENTNRALNEENAKLHNKLNAQRDNLDTNAMLAGLFRELSEAHNSGGGWTTANVTTKELLNLIRKQPKLLEKLKALRSELDTTQKAYGQSLGESSRRMVMLGAARRERDEARSKLVALTDGTPCRAPRPSKPPNFTSERQFMQHIWVEDARVVRTVGGMFEDHVYRMSKTHGHHGHLDNLTDALTDARVLRGSYFSEFRPWTRGYDGYDE